MRAFDPRDPALDGEEERGGALARFGAGGKVFPELEGIGDSAGEYSGRSTGRSLSGRCLDTEISGGRTEREKPERKRGEAPTVHGAVKLDRSRIADQNVFPAKYPILFRLSGNDRLLRR